MGNDLGRRRRADRLAIHREVESGQAELVPDIDRPGSWLLFVDGIPQSQRSVSSTAMAAGERVVRVSSSAIDYTLKQARRSCGARR